MRAETGCGERGVASLLEIGAERHAKIGARGRELAERVRDEGVGCVDILCDEVDEPDHVVRDQRLAHPESRDGSLRRERVEMAASESIDAAPERAERDTHPGLGA